MKRGAGLLLGLALGCGDSGTAPVQDTDEPSSTSSEGTTTIAIDGSDGSADGTSTGESSGAASTDTGSSPACPSGDGVFLSVAPAEPGTLVVDPLADFPTSLADVGLYPDAPDLSVVADVAMHYEPAWPLWSNGSAKHRYVVLPAGETVDTSDPDLWVFPAGTLLFKTFLYDDGVDACPRPVETRLIRKTTGGTWEYAAYGWDPEGATATLLDLSSPVPIPVTGAEGAFEHNVPARIECRSCHESAIGEVLGFERLQLSVPRVEGEPDQLAALLDLGLLSNANDVLLIEDPDDITRRVLGLFQGSCVHCHNGSGGPSSSFDLRHEVALANTIDQPTESSASASGIRIVPGSPEESILFLAYSGETDDPEVSSMPPVGVDLRDAEGIELLRTFILALE